MRISVLCVGKLRELYLREAAEEYIKRISRFTSFQVYEFENVEKLIKKIENFDYKILLDIEGDQMSSKEFADFIRENSLKWKKICFIVGGWKGFESNINEIVDKRISLSKMTFPYQLCRIILLEQIYRAFTIIKGIDYNK